MNNIEEFIKRRFPNEDLWLSGNCYWFATILIHQFPHLDYWYEPIVGHFYAGDGTSFYDWKGLHTDIYAIPFSQIANDDKLWYGRIVRDCIM